MQLFPEKTGEDWWALRDRAILAILAHTGITTAEVIALRGADIRVNAQAALDRLQTRQQHPLALATPEPSEHHATEQHPSEQPTEPTAYWLDVMSGAQSVARSLPLPLSTLKLVADWLQRRQQILHERTRHAAQRAGQPTTADAHALRLIARNAPLFLPRQSPQEADPMAPMDPTTLYHSVKKAFAALADMPDAHALRQTRAPGQAVHVARGAAIIRNTVLAHWLQTLGVQETVARAGLQNERSLRLIVPAPAGAPTDAAAPHA